MRRAGGVALATCLALVAAACARNVDPAADTPGTAPAVAASVTLPLGPAAPVDVVSGVDMRVAPRIDAWGQTVAIAWRDLDGTARVTISPDAGRTFQTRVLDVAGVAEARDLAVAVRAPSDMTLPSQDGQPDSRVEVWCRLGDGATARVVRSTNGGRTFDAPVPDGVSLGEVFPESWEPTSATTRETLALLPPPLLRYVGVQKAARPAAALDDGMPPMTLDEHGALAVIWRERTPTGDVRVLRRYAIDWNGVEAHTPEFDAPTVIVADRDVTAPVLARVPGGVVAVWTTQGTMRIRRVGLDMTCNPNRDR